MKTLPKSSIIQKGLCTLGIELGSTQIKAVLIDENFTPIASGNYQWENTLSNGIWTYSLQDVWTGIQSAYSNLKLDVKNKYDVSLNKVSSLGISGMMHGYLPFNKKNELQTPFRTWRNTNTTKASEELSEKLDFNIPLRWSVSHLYQAILDNENHVSKINYLTTLAGYVHWKLTNKKVLGIGDASGMFPIDSKTKTYDKTRLACFNQLISEKNITWKLENLLPTVLSAGEDAGILTKEGAKLLDPTLELEHGCPLAPPEGDAGTGMIATNSITPTTGNISAGTSLFAMIVLEKALKNCYKEIDIVTTPDGMPVAMVHCNNCTSDINAWANLLEGFLFNLGKSATQSEIFTTLFNAAFRGAPDCGGIVNCNYISGEPLTNMQEGRPLIVRKPNSPLTFENFARAMINGAIVTLKFGMDILKEENITISSLLGHGGFFKTKTIGQQLLANALEIPISVMSTASEGGPWGIAILASYRVNKTNDETLQSYLANKVFAHTTSHSLPPQTEGVDGFLAYVNNFKNVLEIENTAINCF